MEAQMTEGRAKEGLAIKHYAGRWKQALSLAKDDRHHPKLSYWDRVRVLYLELGGLYVGQLPSMQRLSYSVPSETASYA